jgi:VanZ family protein
VVAGIVQEITAASARSVRAKGSPCQISESVALRKRQALNGIDGMTKLLMFSRMGAWLAVQTIIVLSLVPGNMRPHAFGNSYYEHFAAYFITGCLLATGYLRTLQLLSSGVLLATCAGSLELVQLLIPGRTAKIGDFAIGTIGACIGLLVIGVLRRRRSGITRVV